MTSQAEYAARQPMQRENLRYLLTPSIPARFGPEQDAVLLEMSVHGVRIRHGERLVRGDVGDLRFVPGANAAPVVARGLVIWCHRDEDRSDPERPFVSGIETTVRADVMQVLERENLASPIQELRGAIRYVLTPPQASILARAGDITLLDLSETGARIRIAEQIRPGGRGALRSEDRERAARARRRVAGCLEPHSQ